MMQYEIYNMREDQTWTWMSLLEMEKKKKKKSKYNNFQTVQVVQFWLPHRLGQKNLPTIEC